MGERLHLSSTQNNPIVLPVCDVCPLKTVNLAELSTELRQEFNSFIQGMVATAVESWASLEQPAFPEVYGNAIKENSDKEHALQCRHIGSSAISCARNKANKICSTPKRIGNIQ